MATDHFDDPDTSDEARLFRRIHLTHIVEGGGGKSEVSSAAFHDVELSINLERVMQAAGREPKDSLKDRPDDLLVSVTAGVCRQNGQIVGPDPQPEEPAHGYVFGKKTKRIKRALRDAAEWIVPDAAPSWEDVRSRKKELGIGENPSAA
jgi:hypothetical protein